MRNRTKSRKPRRKTNRKIIHPRRATKSGGKNPRKFRHPLSITKPRRKTNRKIRRGGARGLVYKSNQVQQSSGPHGFGEDYWSAKDEDKARNPTWRRLRRKSNLSRIINMAKSKGRVEPL